MTFVSLFYNGYVLKLLPYDIIYHKLVFKTISVYM